VLPPQFGEAPAITRGGRVGQFALDLLVPRERLREKIAEAQLSLPYF
jgi:hypothetical protein